MFQGARGCVIVLLMIDRDEVKKLAELALLDVPPESVDSLVKEMDAILGYVGEVSELAATPTESLKPEPRNVLRDDTDPHEANAYSEELIDAFPQKDGRYLRVKKIL